MNILFPTDFSTNAELASHFAIDLLKRSNGRLYVFNSYDLPYSDRSMSTSLIDVMRENAEENMEIFNKKLRAQGIEAHSEVLLGNPIRMTKELIKKYDINMIVMGTKGASGLEEFLIGSNAASVIQSVDIPVLVIPPKAEIKPIDRIVLASDLDFHNEERPLRRLREFAKLYGSRIDILHIQDEDGIEKGNRELVERVLTDVNHSYTIIRSSNVEKTILQHCEELGAQVVSAIAKRYSFFESLFHQSLTSKLAYHSSIPLLALHQPKKP